MAVNDTVRLDVIGTVGGQQHITTLHFRLQEVTSTDQGLIDSWQSIARTSYRAMFATNDYPVQLLRATQVCGTVPLRAAAEEAELAATQTGTYAPSGQRLPTWLAGMIDWRTGLAGKERRGRMFVGGLWEVDTDGNDLHATKIGQLQAYANALLAAYTVGGTVAGYKLVVYSRKLASVPGTQCQDSSTLISSYLVKTPATSMKSRRVGSGS